MSRLDAVLAALSERFAWGELLGEGAHGWVGRATDLQLGREVALKISKSTGDPSRLARFEREAQIAASLRHPNVVSLHSSGEVAGRPYLVLEYVEGARTLREVFRDSTPQAQLAVLRDVARGVAAAHKQGVVHRDLKPENVLVTATGAGRVTDFGSATMTGVERLTQTGAMIGSPAYMSPEQISGKAREADARCDVWAIGVMLYEVCCGELPFSAGSLLELAGRIESAEVDPQLLPHVPPTLRGVIQRCLKRKPQARYADAGALGRELERACAGERAPPPLGALLGLVLVTLLAVGAAGWTLIQRNSTPPDPLPEPAPEPAPEVPPAEPARPPNADRDAWREVQARLSPAEFLSAGEAWLQSFPESTLRATVEATLAKRRLAEPRWVLSFPDVRYPPGISSSRDDLLTRYTRKDGSRALERWPWANFDPALTHKPWPTRPTAEPMPGGRWWVLSTPQTRSAWYVSTNATPSTRLLRAVLPVTATALKQAQSIPHHVAALTLDPHGERLAMASADRWWVFGHTDHRIEELASGEAPRLTGELELHFDPTRPRVVYGGTRGADDRDLVATFDYEEGKTTLLQKLPFRVTALCPLRDGRTLLASHTGQVVFCDVDMQFGEYLTDTRAKVDGFSGPRVLDGRFNQILETSRGVIYARGRTSKALGATPLLYVWRLGEREPLRRHVTRECRRLLLSPDERYLFLNSLGRVEIWDRYVPGEWSPVD